MTPIKFIDLFAGMGGLRLGFETAFKNAGLETDCVMTSEIKTFAVSTLHKNFKHNYFVGDITKVRNKDVPDFDFLLGGFPCQPFSAGGNRHGFADTRGTLFFDIERILEAKRPYGFILENVEGLVKHDLQNKNDEIGRTLRIILEKLEALGYKVNWKVLNSANFGLPQERKRIFIVGTQKRKINLDGFEKSTKKIKDIIEQGLPVLDTKFTKLLLKHYTVSQLHGKSIKDKRGGSNNIHSWDIGLKGEITKEQNNLLSQLFKERRKKKWATEHGIKWMDGMPLTLQQIKTFSPLKNLKKMLDDLVTKGYLKMEYPKKVVIVKTDLGIRRVRVEDTSLKKGYNIVSGKLSFEINKILDPNSIAPTLVATDMERLVVPDGNGVRRMTLREGMRLFGYPEWFEMPVSIKEGYDLLGNTVAVNVVEAVSSMLAKHFKGSNKNKDKAHNQTNGVPVAAA